MSTPTTVTVTRGTASIPAVILCPHTGVQNDDGSVSHYGHVAYSTDEPDEGVYPLGAELRREAEGGPS